MTEFKSEKEFLSAYDIHNFDVPLVTVDMAIFTIKDAALNALLVKRADYPAKGKWALPGGFIDLKNDKDLNASAYRKLKEKTGINTAYLEQVGTVGSSKRDPRGWSLTVAYMALISSENIKLITDDSSELITWVPVNEVTDKLKLAFDHQDILENCHARLKAKVQYTSLPVNLLPDNFTLTELQKTFEIVLGKTVEKKSFRRRVLDANILKETGKMKKGSNRPAKLYSINSNGDRYFFARNIEGSR